MFVSKNDLLSDISDQRWARDQVLDGELLNESKTLIYYKEYNYGHYSFMVANDMKYLTHVKQLLEEFNKPNKREEIYINEKGKIIIWVDNPSI